MQYIEYCKLMKGRIMNCLTCCLPTKRTYTPLKEDSRDQADYANRGSGHPASTSGLS